MAAEKYLNVVKARRVPVNKANLPENLKKISLDYAIELELERPTNGIGGQTEKRTIFNSNKVHSKIFSYVDSAMGEKYPDSWKTNTKEAPLLDFPSDKQNNVVARIIKHKLPLGERIIRILSSGTRKEATEVNMVVFGSPAIYDNFGNMVEEAWGESPRDLWESLKNAPFMKTAECFVEHYNPNSSVDASDLEDLGKKE